MQVNMAEKNQRRSKTFLEICEKATGKPREGKHGDDDHAEEKLESLSFHIGDGTAAGCTYELCRRATISDGTFDIYHRAGKAERQKYGKIDLPPRAVGA